MADVAIIALIDEATGYQKRRAQDALYTVWYNFVRIHKTLRVTPAMAAGVSATLWSMDDVVALVDTATAVPAVRGPYRKRQPAAEISN